MFQRRTLPFEAFADIMYPKCPGNPKPDFAENGTAGERMGSAAMTPVLREETRRTRE